MLYNWKKHKYWPADSQRLCSPLQVTRETAPYLEAICRSPAANEPRLIYCDWLEQQGYIEWAGFIRAHLQLSDWPSRADEQVIADKCKAIVKLEYPALYEEWIRQEAEWSHRMADVPPGMEIDVWLEGGMRVYLRGGSVPQPPWEQVVQGMMTSLLPSGDDIYWHSIRRGFINGLYAPESFLIRHGRELVRTLPLDELKIKWQDRSSELFQQRELLQHIMSIEYSGGGDHAAKALAQCDTCPKLTTLRFGESLTDQGGLVLARAKSLDSITYLDVGSFKFSAEVGTALQNRFQRDSSEIPCKLHIYSCKAESPPVSYPGSYLGVWGIKDLCAKWSYNVTEVKINRHRIGDEGLAVLVQQPWMENITWIEVMDDEIGVSGIHSLTQSPYLRNLKVLVLHRNPISDDGIKVLAQASNLPGLQRLGCRTCKLSDQSVEYFLGSSLSKLRAINMGDNPISPDGYARLKPRFGDCVNYTPPKD